MAIRSIELSASTERKVAKVVEHAKKKRNWFLVGPGGKIGIGTMPGQDRRHCCQLDDYRCVFSYTSSDDKVWLQLSISVAEGKGPLPHPTAVKVIAHLFGFSGEEEELDVKHGVSVLDPLPDPSEQYFPKTWHIAVRKDHPVDGNCITLAEDTGLRP